MIKGSKEKIVSKKWIVKTQTGKTIERIVINEALN